MEIFTRPHARQIFIHSAVKSCTVLSGKDDDEYC